MTAATTSLRERLRIIATDYEPGSILRATVDEAIAALSTPPAGEWMPIESAPREPHSRAIVCCQSLHEGQPSVVGEAYLNPDGEWWWAQTGPGDYTSDPISETNGPITRWQPLPAPPEPATQEVG